ncbi:TonB-dependent receptor [Acinetobacter soli]
MVTQLMALVLLFFKSIAYPRFGLRNIVWQDGNYGESPNETTQSSFYTSAKIELLDNLKAIAGVRLSNWKYETEMGSGNRKFDNQITPYFGMIYDFDQNHSVYASYTDIFNPQRALLHKAILEGFFSNIISR